MFIRNDLERDKRLNAEAQAKDVALKRLALDFLVESDKYGYAYQWTWLGLPIIQMPPDILATQEIIWQSKPDLIIETGIAWGGSLVFYASLLQLIGKGEVVGVDLNLMDHVAAEIMAYPFSNRIHLYKGSSTDPDIVAKVKSHVPPGGSVMVLLDSSHTHEHVLAELQIYAPLVTKDQYLVVSDTIIDYIPAQVHRPRPWGPGANPKTALRAYLATTERFVLDDQIDNKTLLSCCPAGYFRCVSD